MKSIPNIGSLLNFLQKKESLVKKSKVIVEDLDTDVTDDEFTSEEKALIVSNSKKFFKKNFLIFKSNKPVRSDSGGKGFR